MIGHQIDLPSFAMGLILGTYLGCWMFAWAVKTALKDIKDLLARKKPDDHVQEVKDILAGKKL